MKSLRLFRQKFSTPEFWWSTARVLIGLFFIGAAIYKTFNYFLIGDQTLQGDFEYWLKNGWRPQWYAFILQGLLPYEKLLALATVLLQLIPGIMLVLNYRVRMASLFLLFIQLNIFAGTLNFLGFNEFIGVSVWMALYFVIFPKGVELSRRKLWGFFTFLLLVLLSLQLYLRYRAGDPWLSSVNWQRLHYARDIMATHLLWKQFLLWLTSGSIGAYLWVSAWWIQATLSFSILTRYRLYAGAGLLILAIFRSLMWMNSTTSYGVIWVLLLFLWTSQEYCLKRLSSEKNNGRTPLQKKPISARMRSSNP